MNIDEHHSNSFGDNMDEAADKLGSSSNEEGGKKGKKRRRFTNEEDNKIVEVQRASLCVERYIQSISCRTIREYESSSIRAKTQSTGTSSYNGPPSIGPRNRFARVT